MEIITQSARETQKLGEKIGHDLILDKFESRILCLYGELGSGKTTFIQGLAKGLGIKKRITSPTFVFIRQYEISLPRSPFGHLGGGEATTSTPARCDVFYHVDLYRIEKKDKVQNLGLEEIFSESQAVVAIEWAEKIKEMLPEKRIDIQFNYLNQNERKVIIR